MDPLVEFDMEAEMMVRASDVRRSRELEARVRDLEEQVRQLMAEREEARAGRLAAAEAMVEHAFAPVEVRQGPQGEMPVYDDEPKHGRIIRHKQKEPAE